MEKQVKRRCVPKYREHIHGLDIFISNGYGVRSSSRCLKRAGCTPPEPAMIEHDILKLIEHDARSFHLRAIDALDAFAEILTGRVGRADQYR
jgi:hypothetical protein